MRNWITGASLGAFFIAIPITGAAQDNPAAAEPALQEVIVTSQRRAENLQKAALAVSAISGDQFANSGATRVQDLTQLVPSLQVSTAAGPYPLFYMRGVGNINANALSDSALALSLDGVYLARPSGTGGIFYDIERIEVLKGPQGTLYGRNATGGAINVITRKPGHEFGGVATLDAGNEGLFKFGGALNLPLGERVAARLSAQTIDRDGYMSDGTDDEKGRSGRAQLLFEPTDSLRILGAADFYHMGGRGVGATLINPSGSGFSVGDGRVGLTDPRSSAIFSQAFVFTAGDVLGPMLQKTVVAPAPVSLRQDNDYWGVSATLDWTTDPGTLTVIPAYRHSKLDYTSDAPSFLIDQNETDEQKSIEARFASDDSRRWSYLLGAFYIDEDITVDPIFDQQFNGSVQHFEPGTQSYAAFGRLRYSLTDNFRLTGGLRYTHDDKQFQGRLDAKQTLCPGSFIPPPAGPRFCFGGVGQVVVPIPPMVLDTEKTWSETTWRAGLEWDAGPQSLLYVSAETGFKAGGFFFSHDDPTYDPEKITAYTLGSKNRLLDGRLQLNGEAFWWKYRDQQLSHLAVDSTGAFVFATENVGRAEMKGAELEAQFLARSNTLLAADVQYLNAVYENFVYRLPNLGAPPAVSCPFNGGAPPTAFVVNCSGKTPPQSPRWTVNLTLQQTFLLGNSGAIVADVHTHFQTKTLTGLEFLDLEYQDSYWMSGLSLGYQAPGERWSLSGYVENIEDKAVVQGTFPHPLAPLYAATLRPPRTYGVRLGVNF